METPSAETTLKQHSRHGSSGRALPRRSTRGPLDINDSPIAPSSVTSPTSLAPQRSSLLSPSQSQYMTPRMPSPGPGSILSYRTARTSLSPSRSNLSSTGTQQKDFSFLLRPEIYHPLTLLDVPPPFRPTPASIDPSTPLPDLVSTGHFRAAAIKAANTLTTPDFNTSDPREIFELVYTRLSCLTLCNQTNLASQEVKALEDLNSNYYRDDTTREHLVPWELRVLAVRLQGIGFNDARRGVMGYYDLARDARSVLTNLKKVPLRSRDDAAIKLWAIRLAELGIRVASALIEMEDLESATRFMATLNSADDTAAGLEMQKALLWLCLGDIDAARGCITGHTNGNESKVILALAYMADSEFEEAVALWKELLATLNEGESEAAMCKQNLGVSLLYLGRMDEARTHLETLISAPNPHSFHALTFNLSTIYELCTERSRALKISLAERVAAQQESSGKREGSEKANGDFKL